MAVEFMVQREHFSWILLWCLPFSAALVDGRVISMARSEVVRGCFEMVCSVTYDGRQYA